MKAHLDDHFIQNLSKKLILNNTFNAGPATTAVFRDLCFMNDIGLSPLAVC